MAGEFDPRQLIINFAKDNPEVQALQFIRDDPHRIHFKLNEHGLVNYVYRVQSANNKSSVIIKYGKETMRRIPEEKIPLQRQEVEYNSLCLMHSIQPGSVPQPLCLDKKHHILAMSDMSEWELLGTQLGERHLDLQVATKIGQLLGKVHFETSEDNVSKEEWEELKRKFGQEDIAEKYVKEYTMTRRYDATDPITNVSKENLGTFQKYTEEMRCMELPEKLSQLYNMQICFIHADCHYKSIFVKEGHVALFDFEFSFLGHPAYNVSRPQACYLVSYILDDAADEHMTPGRRRQGFGAACLHAVKTMTEAYLCVNKSISNSETSRMKFMSALALFTGHSIFRIGTSVHTRLDDKDRRQVMTAGYKLMRHHDTVKTVDQYIDLICLKA